ncbi:hypothetical protein [Sediminibacterium soli]|uniref:hypothetical protein n=1 Tax=Sediminibacterium soli TaxID=2698829 RepID=UPI00137B4F20|nr:hypothetical protein [Sediminibacterium soli]NCI46292.1 hypothetical protein [Sediminibacterium soli]
MKKFLLFAACAATLQIANAQDPKNVEKFALLGRYEDAKTEVDKSVTDPKFSGKPEAWYWKARVYSELAKTPATATKYPNAMQDADAAFRKYEELDPTMAVAKAKGSDGYFNMYSTAFNAGIKQFNDKKWDDAAKSFDVSNQYINTIIRNKWTTQSLLMDTIGVLYAAYAYQNGKKNDQAAKYYAILADNKIGGDTYIDAYKFLAVHYTDTKNEAMFHKYLALAREVYPKEGWDEFDVDYMDKNLSLDEKLAAYNKGDAAGTLSEMYYLQFGDVFVKAKTEPGLDEAKHKEFTAKAAEAFKKAYAKNNQNALAAFNVGVIYYNMFVELDDKYAANIRAMQALNADKPVEKDPKKKAAAEAALKVKIDPLKAANTALEKPISENLDVAAEWLEKSYAILKDKATRTGTEKSVIGKSVDFLANIYQYKRDRARGKDNKVFEAYEAKFKEFDALHGKY